MRVLIVGSDRGTRPVVEALRAAGTAADRASPEAAVRALAVWPARFALVLAERQGGLLADCRLHDAVVRTGAVVQLLFLAPPLASTAGEAPPVCTIEQAPEGDRLLRCALAHRRSGAGSEHALVGACGDRSHVLAYCAPTRRTR